MLSYWTVKIIRWKKPVLPGVMATVACLPAVLPTSYFSSLLWATAKLLHALCNAL